MATPNGTQGACAPAIARSAGAFGGMNDEQLRLVIGEIVSTAGYLSNYLRVESQEPSTEALEIGARLAASIGLLGDHILERECVVVNDFSRRGAGSSNRLS